MIPDVKPSQNRVAAGAAIARMTPVSLLTTVTIQFAKPTSAPKKKKICNIESQNTTCLNMCVEGTVDFCSVLLCAVATGTCIVMRQPIVTHAMVVTTQKANIGSSSIFRLKEMNNTPTNAPHTHSTHHLSH